MGTPSRTLRIRRLLTALPLLFVPPRSIPNAIGEEIAKKTGSIFPLRDCMIRKVKMLKKPKFDIVKLMELHEGGEDAGKGVGRDEPTVEVLKGSGGRL